MMSIDYRDQTGFTIMELVVSISLMGIVLALAYMFLNFSFGSYTRGEEKTIAQQATRIAAGFITTELRFANKIEINPEDAIGTGNYSYIYQYDDSVILLDGDGNKIILADGPADNTTYSFYIFCKETDFTSIPDKYQQYLPTVFPSDLVVFIIEAGDDFYYLATSVQALNLSIYENTILANEGSGKVVKYYKPSE